MPAGHRILRRAPISLLRIRSNAITLTESFFDGSIDYNGVISISGATGTYTIPTLSYYHSFGFFSGSAYVVASLPYGVGNFLGTATEMQLYRSGLLDSVYRVSANLHPLSLGTAGAPRADLYHPRPHGGRDSGRQAGEHSAGVEGRANRQTESVRGLNRGD
jgi:hypothetical protein